MPFMSPNELTLMSSAIRSRDSQIEKANQKLEKTQAVNKFLVIGEAIGGAALFGYVRGLYENPQTGEWNVPQTTVDIELLTVAGAAGLALLGVYYKPLVPYAHHAANVAAGIGGHYSGQIFRKMAKSKQFGLVAGVPGIGALPQYDPQGFDPSQFGSPYEDAASAAMSASGV